VNVRYLSIDDAMVLCRVLGELKVRDAGLLDSALHRPQSGFGGFEVYESLPLKAAALLHSLAKNHALFDGNKRLAWMASDVFLARHGLTSSLSQQEAIDFMLAVAGSQDDLAIEDLAEGLRIVELGDPNRPSEIAPPETTRSRPLGKTTPRPKRSMLSRRRQDSPPTPGRAPGR